MQMAGGVLPVLATPFDRHSEIDRTQLERLVDWQYEQGADGVTIAMVSEILRLSVSERESLAAAVVAASADRGSVVVSVGHESTHLATRLAKSAETTGATAIMAIPPISVPLADDQLLGYFSAIADSTVLPLIVQDASGYVGTPMSISLQARLLEDFGAEKILFKPEAVPLGPRLTALMDATGQRAQAFEGSGGSALIDTYPRGVVGTMPGSDLTWAVKALWYALENKQVARADEIHSALLPLVSLSPGLDTYIAVEKYLLHKQNVLETQYVREPASYRIDEATRIVADRMFDQLNHVVRGGKK
ncbi:dihydrodipicolinate synthase family protein [Nocardia australiensis]|uniref:dihydrodipicolinate synthase family protein n=1 Tax=Nocardia australiensis TaxID=2887191 RepID=UPI001D142F3A|nr:dihydrodipicolinate synthase family protein [Nocardia australiensis]